MQRETDIERQSKTCPYCKHYYREHGNQYPMFVYHYEYGRICRKCYKERTDVNQLEVRIDPGEMEVAFLPDQEVEIQNDAEVPLTFILSADTAGVYVGVRRADFGPARPAPYLSDSI